MKSGVLVFVALLVSFSAVLGACKKIDDAIAAVEKASQTLGNSVDSANASLQTLGSEFPRRIDETIRTEVDGLVSRGVQHAQVAGMCSVDFLLRRVDARLKRIRAMLINLRDKKNDPVPLILPVVCTSTPAHLNLYDESVHWNSIMLTGFDFDLLDSQGKKIGILLETDAGEMIPLPDNQIGRTSHYQLQLDLAGPNKVTEQLLCKRNVRKVHVSFDGKPGVSEPVLIERNPSTRDEVREIGAIAYTPPYIDKKGSDRDFDTKDDKPMRVDASGEIKQTDERTIKLIVRMHAWENKSNDTEVSGEDEWRVAYTAPEGWRIQSFTPLPKMTSISKSMGNDDRGVDFPMVSGEVVKNFHIWADHGGDDAGSFTRVEVKFNTLRVHLVQASRCP